MGAWWIGPLFTGFAAISVAFLMACFPKELPCKSVCMPHLLLLLNLNTVPVHVHVCVAAAVKYKADRKSEAYKGAGEKEANREDFGRSVSDVWLTIKTTFSNPVWILLTISGTVESGAVIGFAAFLPKVNLNSQTTRPRPRSCTIMFRHKF